jgi:dTDP-4-dehydrorhamnose 3,5-epimerase
MKYIKTKFAGLLIVEPDIFEDNRGYFFESFNEIKFRETNAMFYPVQDNESFSRMYVIRGLHYQAIPYAQTKLVRVIQGTIFDIAVNLRDEEFYGQWFGIELSSDNKRQLLIPKGFAHGFSVLSDSAIVQYKCDNVYNPNYERVIPAINNKFNIDWKIDIDKAIISDKDKISK